MTQKKPTLEYDTPTPHRDRMGPFDAIVLALWILMMLAFLFAVVVRSC